MNIEKRKLNLIQWLISLENLGIINHLESFKKETEDSKEWWEDLTAKQQTSVEVSLEQIKNGQYISNEEAMKGNRKQYNT